MLKALFLIMALAFVQACGLFGSGNVAPVLEKCGLAEGSAAFAEVSAILLAGDPDWMAQLEAEGVKVGVAVVECIVKDFVDGTAARKQASEQRVDAAVRGRMFLQKHGVQP